jgi:dephospho-CoA kinase
MLKLVKIAVTGGVASGKTTVCQLFQKLGAYVVSADAIAHELFDPHTDLGQQIVHTLGSDILQNGKINKQLVAEKVFKDPKRLLELEKILHPPVLKEIEQQYAIACKTEGFTAFVVEVPLLFEIGAEAFYDVTIAVEAEPDIAKRRFQAKGYKEEDYIRRMGRQLAPHVKAAKAHYTIKNNGTLEDLEKQVQKLTRDIIHEA